MKGQIKIHKFKSEVLKNNPLKDPYIRDILEYLPKNYSSSYSRGYPTIFLLPSFGSDNYSTINTNPFSLTIYQTLENLIDENRCVDMIIASVNCFNKFGGSQYIILDNTTRFFYLVIAVWHIQKLLLSNIVFHYC